MEIGKLYLYSELRGYSAPKYRTNYTKYLSGGKITIIKVGKGLSHYYYISQTCVSVCLSLPKCEQTKNDLNQVWTCSILTNSSIKYYLSIHLSN